MLPRALTARGAGRSSAAAAAAAPATSASSAPATPRQQPRRRRSSSRVPAAASAAMQAASNPSPSPSSSRPGPHHHRRAAAAGLGAAARHPRRPLLLPAPCRATIDDFEIQVLARRLEANSPKLPPPSDRPKLARAIELIDRANSADPKKVPGGSDGRGPPEPFRLAYGRAVYDEAVRLDPRAGASDALLILARGRQVESWLLASLLKRDDYAPNTPGARQWQNDRRRWLARRLLRCMREAGYRGPLTPAEVSGQAAARAAGEPDPLADVAHTFEPFSSLAKDKDAASGAAAADPADAAALADEAATIKLVEEVMMGKGVPDPRDLRPYDFSAPLGQTNWPLLRAAVAVQSLADADALVFLDRNFARMLDDAGMTPDEAAAAARPELLRMSARGMAAALRKPWLKEDARKKQALLKALPVPFKYSDMMLDVEGTAAASVHPGDWRYRDFDYE